MRTTSLQDRMMILELAASGLSDGVIAERLGWSLATVRKWRRRGQHQGRGGLASRMGRPAHGALSSFARDVKDALRTWRQQHPRWGPQTLVVQAHQATDLSGQRLPKRATVGRWLQQQGLTRRYQRHRELPAATTGAAQAAHEAWELDAYGAIPVPAVGIISLLDLNDCFSHVKLLSSRVGWANSGSVAIPTPRIICWRSGWPLPTGVCPANCGWIATASTSIAPASRRFRRACICFCSASASPWWLGRRISPANGRSRSVAIKPGINKC